MFIYILSYTKSLYHHKSSWDGPYIVPYKQRMTLTFTSEEMATKRLNELCHHEDCMLIKKEVILPGCI